MSEKFQLVLDVAQKAQVLPRAPARGVSAPARGVSTLARGVSTPARGVPMLARGRSPPASAAARGGPCLTLQARFVRCQLTCSHPALGSLQQLWWLGKGPPDSASADGAPGWSSPPSPPPLARVERPWEGLRPGSAVAVSVATSALDQSCAFPGLGAAGQDHRAPGDLRAARPGGPPGVAV